MIMYMNILFHDENLSMTKGPNTNILMSALYSIQPFKKHLIIGQFNFSSVFLAWAWLAKAIGHSCHTKNQLLPKPFTGKKRVKVRSSPGHKATKRSVEITMHLGLDHIIKLKFTKKIDRCAILNVLNCLTKN